MAEVINSYLVSLSATADKASFDKFQSLLASTQKTVDNTIGGMTAKLLAFQVAGVTAFATVGFGIVGYIDKLAMADQKTKLLATQNMMSTQQYRSVSMALDTLGVSLDDVFFGTKELQDRFHGLIDDQKQLALMMGPSYEQQMQQVRDVVYQLQRLEVKGQYFGMKFASDLLEKLGFGNGGIAVQLEKLNDYVMQHMPGWSSEISTDVIPVLEDLWGMLKDIGGLAGQVGGDFTRLVGILSGDQEILGDQTMNFHKFARAVEDVVHWLSKFIEIMTAGEKIVANGIMAPINILAAGKDLITGHPGRAWDDIKAAWGNQKSMWAGWGDAYNAATGKTSYDSSSTTSFNPLAAPNFSSPGSDNSDFMRLVRGIAQVESGGSQYDRYGRVKVGPQNPSGELAIGMMQLLPSTARRLGVNPYDPAQNYLGGQKYLAQLLQQHHGNVEAALADYGGARSMYSPQGQDYIRKVESAAGINVGTIIVNVPPTAHSPEMIATAVKRGVRDGINEHTQHLATETAGAYY